MEVQSIILCAWGLPKGISRTSIHCTSSPWVLNRGAFHLEELTYQDVRQQPVLLMIAYARCLQHRVEKNHPPKNPDFCPWAECVRELWQTVWEYVNITYRDVMQGLEIEKCEASHPGMTIFSWLLANPTDEPRIVEDPPCQESPSPKDKAIWCAPPPQGLEQHERHVLVVTSSVGWLDLRGSGDDVRESQGSRSLFQNCRMLAMFPPPRAVSHYGGATLTKLNDWRHYRLPIGDQLKSAVGQITDHPLPNIPNIHCWVDNQFLPYEHSALNVFIFVYSGDF